MNPFSIDSWLLSLVLGKDVSKDREGTFGGINEASLAFFAFSAERRAESMSEDSTLIFSDSNMFVWTSDIVGSVLSD